MYANPHRKLPLSKKYRPWSKFKGTITIVGGIHRKCTSEISHIRTERLLESLRYDENIEYWDYVIDNFGYRYIEYKTKDKTGSAKFSPKLVERLKQTGRWKD